MLALLGAGFGRHGRMSRRDLLRVGALGFGGLTLPDLLRRQARAGASSPLAKSVIMIWLRGGPSHIDSYDMKPAAPAEVRGEFASIATNVPGVDLCEYLPRHAKMMDRLAVIRGIRSNDLGDHTPHYILTGTPDRGKRPTLGAVVSYLQRKPRDLPPYVSTFRWGFSDSTYTGSAHDPFIPKGEGLENLRLERTITLDRLRGRRDLLAQLDRLPREMDRGAFAGVDAFTERAVEIISSPEAREAFDLKQESAETRERYGKYCESFLMARRLVEAGVSIVTVKVGDWDTHEKNFRDMREQLPQLDRGFEALITDLYDRGLERRVAVVMWGEFGRAPRISRVDGRDHWPEAGAAIVAGGGFRVGQAIGETDHHGGRSLTAPYTPSNVMANLYRHLEIDPAQAIPDHQGRPMHLLDDRRPVTELL